MSYITICILTGVLFLQKVSINFHIFIQVNNNNNPPALMLVVASNNGKLIIQLEWPNLAHVQKFTKLPTTLNGYHSYIGNGYC